MFILDMSIRNDKFENTDTNPREYWAKCPVLYLEWKHVYCLRPAERNNHEKYPMCAWYNYWLSDVCCQFRGYSTIVQSILHQVVYVFGRAEGNTYWKLFFVWMVIIGVGDGLLPIPVLHQRRYYTWLPKCYRLQILTSYWRIQCHPIHRKPWECSFTWYRTVSL